MVEQNFLECARTIGVEGRIAALLLDCDRALEEYPEAGDRRWFSRLEEQRQRLLNPDLRVRVALTTRLAEETPSLAPLIAAAMRELVLKHPDLRPFHARLTKAVAGGERP